MELTDGAIGIDTYSVSTRKKYAEVDGRVLRWEFPSQGTSSREMLNPKETVLLLVDGIFDSGTLYQPQPRRTAVRVIRRA